MRLEPGVDLFWRQPALSQGPHTNITYQALQNVSIACWINRRHALQVALKKSANYSESQVFIHGGALAMDLSNNRNKLAVFLLGWTLLICGCASDDDDKPRQHQHRHRHGQDQSETSDRWNSPSQSPTPY
jgi:hypothetical protein